MDLELLFPWLTLDPELVARDSRLEPHLLDGDAKQADLIEDVAREIEVQAGRVALRLTKEATPYTWPFAESQWRKAMPTSTYTTTERDRRRLVQERNANTATRELVIAALNRPLGGEDNAKRAEAEAATAEGILKELVDDVKSVATSITNCGNKQQFLGSISMGKG